MLPAASVSKLRESLADWKWTFPFPFHGVVFLSVPSATIFNQVIAPFVPKRCWVNTRNDYLVPHRIFVTKTSCNNKPNKAVRVKIEERYSLDGIMASGCVLTWLKPVVIVPTLSKLATTYELYVNVNTTRVDGYIRTRYWENHFMI